ncbi:MAG: SPW repeat protein [Bradyrhizobiaceae bacterium]|nr:SPW repeat protein [Bradyrhizobiaceae bacterium]
MADRTYSLPQQWEDWASWILGIWLMISPWALRFDLDEAPTRNAVIVGFFIVFTEVVELSIFRDWEEWINVVLGVWLVTSPWILAISERSATINFTLVGLLVLALALYEIRVERARRSS